MRPRRRTTRGDLTTTVLVAGIGNIFLGDDGFGPAVLRRLSGTRESGVRVADYGIRGMHLAYDLLDGWDALLLVDALPNRGAPGRIEVLRAEPDCPAAQLDAHAMNPEAVFAAVRALGGAVPPTVVVGCQVASVEEGIGLSEPVAAAVPAAASVVETVLAQLRTRQEV
ncbi:hydrogenase maturation protease [Nocardia pseudobrasiliensis]|uniref:Hydrogenase maturation protease n=1 Tax=Nocardia pseudobrasiliensis TaxID=45979 RepID=A0A370HSU8_9NOCA|nr:hydrogenase maturation protease [Nocardia pseudobrasiliensis]RDI61602.1 hydrogenase maturation protease [Nocardia pseudobrasiliensis]